MSGWLLDTNVISELRRPRPSARVRSFIAGQRLDDLFVSTVTFAEIRYGIETVSLRIGSSFPAPRDRRMLATYLSYDDAERLVAAALTAPVVGHSIVYGMSDNPLTWWDNTPARHIGYRPQDSSEPFREALYARTPTPDPQDPAAVYQGGGFVRMGPFDGKA